MGKTLKIDYGDRVEYQEMPDAFFAGLNKMAAWDGWCRCDNQQIGEIVHHGHSCDVFCANCGNCLQVG